MAPRPPIPTLERSAPARSGELGGVQHAGAPHLFAEFQQLRVLRDLPFKLGLQLIWNLKCHCGILEGHPITRPEGLARG